MLHDDFILLHKVSMLLPFEKNINFIRNVETIDLKFLDFKSK